MKAEGLQPNPITWDVEIGEWIIKQVLELDPGNATDYVLLLKK
jgi:hypothetical protein